MQPNVELVYALQRIAILLGAGVCAVFAFCAAFSKPRPSKLDSVFHGVVAAVCTFAVVAFAIGLLCRVTVGTWCEGCREFH